MLFNQWRSGDGAANEVQLVYARSVKIPENPVRQAFIDTWIGLVFVRTHVRLFFLHGATSMVFEEALSHQLKSPPTLLKINGSPLLLCHCLAFLQFWLSVTHCQTYLQFVGSMFQCLDGCLETLLWEAVEGDMH